MNTSLRDTMKFLIQEPAEAYHAKRKDYLTSHQLADFRLCPLLYHQKQQGLVPERDRPAFLVGRAAHTLILEGPKAYEYGYVVGGPINPKTDKPYGNQTKAFAEWARQQGKPVITDEQAALVACMNEGVRRNTTAVELLSWGRAEGVVRAVYAGTRCQIRLDWFHPNVGIVDLKTCDDLTWFVADARRYGYVLQLAFYRAVLREVIDEMMSVHIIAVEKKEPYRCGVWRVGNDVLGGARADNEEAIAQLRDCQASGVWPTGYEAIRVLDYA